MCLRLICPFLKLRAWWVSKRSEVLCCEGSPGQSNVQLATGKGKEAEVMGYERHGQCSCTIGLVALSTDGCAQDERRDTAWTISIMLNG